MKYSPDQHDGFVPATPESDTPETKQCSICLAHPPYGNCAGDESCAYILTLERRLAQAQAEIKGHMRIEDDLKATIAGLLTKKGP